jgi:peptidoglycan/xylan/chitin deacetylase (PgdA/CDA1 family)
MTPPVSAIVLAVGPDRVVERTVESLAAQSIAGLEVVVVHRGDEAAVRRRVAAIAGVFEVDVVETAATAAGALRNAGVRASGGESFVVLDGSERLDPEYLSAVRLALDQTPHAGFAASAVRDFAGAAAGAGGPQPRRTLDFPDLLAGPWAAPRATLIRRAVFDQAGGFDPQLAEFVEWDLLLTAVANGHPGVEVPAALLARFTTDDVRLRESLRVDRHLPAVRAIVTRHRAHFESAAARVLIDRERIAKRLWAEERALVARRDSARAELASAMADLSDLRRQLEPRERDALEWGDLRRTTPVSRNWGLDRGRPIDRYYIEAFIAEHAADIRGHVLEVLDSGFTTSYGGDRVERSDVVDIDAGNSRATVIADLRTADQIPSETYDCFILTQTLHLIDDMRAVVRHAYRILKPGGVLLVTVPSASMVAEEYGASGDHWRLTEAGARALFGDFFDQDDLQVAAKGNVLAITAFLYGLSCDEVSEVELASSDPAYPLLVTVRATKPLRVAAAPRRRPGGAVILLYHRVAALEHDVHGLAVPPEVARDQLAHLRARWNPMPLEDLAEAVRAGDPPERAVALTFDDGYLDNLERALPLLRELELPATLFLTTERPLARRRYWWDVLEEILLQAPGLPPRLRLRVGGEIRELVVADDAQRLAAHGELHAVLKTSLPAVRDEVMRELARATGVRRAATGADRPMTADEMRVAAAAPGISIGAHGVHHVSLAELPHDDRHREIFDSRAELERIVERPVTSFAYPYGDLSADAVDTVRAAGFRLAVGCDARALRSRDPLFRLPRLAPPAVGGAAFEEWLEQVSGGRSS